VITLVVRSRSKNGSGLHTYVTVTCIPFAKYLVFLEDPMRPDGEDSVAVLTNMAAPNSIATPSRPAKVSNRLPSHKGAVQVEKFGMCRGATAMDERRRIGRRLPVENRLKLDQAAVRSTEALVTCRIIIFGESTRTSDGILRDSTGGCNPGGCNGLETASPSRSRAQDCFRSYGMTTVISFDATLSPPPESTLFTT